MKKLLVVLLCLFITACGTKTKNSDISDSVLRKYKEDLSYIKKTKKFDNVSDMNQKRTCTILRLFHIVHHV